MYDFEEMKQFVHKTLEENDALKSKKFNHHFRNRYMHSMRVLGWAQRIIEDLECDQDILYTACIFHDVGYAKGKGNHAEASAEIFEEYAKEHNFPLDFTKKVHDIIQLHSNKELLQEPNQAPELILLLEADLLDEEGALGIVWDFMAIGGIDGITFYDSIEALKHSLHIVDQEYMVTKKAKEIWEEKKKFVIQFKEELIKDLFLED